MLVAEPNGKTAISLRECAMSSNPPLDWRSMRSCARIVPAHPPNTVKHEGPPERRPLCNLSHLSHLITMDYNRRTSRGARVGLKVRCSTS
jgi:hypothetical protein